MTAPPYDLFRYYSAEEFLALPEDTGARYELQEGVIVVSPRPAYAHMKVQTKLIVQLDPQVTGDLEVLTEAEVNLELGSDTVRCPDLAIIRSRGADRGSRAIAASDVEVAIEILSPSSRRTDRITKMADYADAGIANYWIIDPDGPVTASVYRLADGAYQESQRDVPGTLTVSEPCELTVDLDALLPR